MLISFLDSRTSIFNCWVLLSFVFVIFSLWTVLQIGFVAAGTNISYIGVESVQAYYLNESHPDSHDEAISSANNDQSVFSTARPQGETNSLHNNYKVKWFSGCEQGNPIDTCWLWDPDWDNHRQNFASCVVGFGRDAAGGRNGDIYEVSDSGDDPKNPKPGTLRYGATRSEPLWIIFAQSMTIKLKGELWVSSHKTIDGRGVEVHIHEQISLHYVEHVILHGLHIHDVVHELESSPTQVSSTKVVTNKSKQDPGRDGIQIRSSKHIWIDHCYLSNAPDGLIDIIKGSTDITISNNYFANHNKVMLLGSSSKDEMDKSMRVTIAFNKFGPNLVQRMPRARYGVIHIINNDYSNGWNMYAIGGSDGPTILSEGNHFKPTKYKEVTRHFSKQKNWEKWNWASSGDIFLDGAFFTNSGEDINSSTAYNRVASTWACPAQTVPDITQNVGPLSPGKLRN